HHLQRLPTCIPASLGTNRSHEYHSWHDLVTVQKRLRGRGSAWSPAPADGVGPLERRCNSWSYGPPQDRRRDVDLFRPRGGLALCHLAPFAERLCGFSGPTSGAGSEADLAEFRARFGHTGKRSKGLSNR